MGTTGKLTAQQWRCYLDRYYRLTETVDRALAVIFDGLAAGGWLDNTLVVFTSDHGEGMAAHRWATKLGFWEEVTRVPLIIVPPGGFNRPAPRVESERLVSLLDFTPTALDYAGVPSAEWPVQRGQSLRPLLEGRPAPQREFIVTALDPNPQHPANTARMVVSADGWKYCRYSSGERAEQLFDLNTDPGETRNLAANPEAARQRDRLRAQLCAWCRTTADPFLAIEGKEP